MKMQHFIAQMTRNSCHGPFDSYLADSCLEKSNKSHTSIDKLWVYFPARTIVFICRTKYVFKFLVHWRHCQTLLTSCTFESINETKSLMNLWAQTNCFSRTSVKSASHTKTRFQMFIKRFILLFHPSISKTVLRTWNNKANSCDIRESQTSEKTFRGHWVASNQD